MTPMTATMDQMTPTIESDCSRSVIDLDVDRSEGVVSGLAARWDHPYRVSDDGGQTFYEEVWRQGAATKSIRERRFFELRYAHSDGDRVGLTEFYERSDALRFEARIEPEYEELRQAAADGDLTDVSVRYTRVRQDALRSDRLLIVEARLRELSLVPPGAPRAQYEDAKIESYRSHDEAAAEVLERRAALIERTKAAIEAAKGLPS